MIRITCVILLQILSISILFAQDVSIEVEKEIYKFDEEIVITYKIDFKADSIKKPIFKNLKLIGGVAESSSMSVVNGEENYSKTWTYRLRPIQRGKIYIEIPSIFLNGKRIKSPKKTILVLDSKMTEQELKKHQFKIFVEDDLKPKGTYRYVLGETFGYIEIYGELDWEFHRKLTESEFSLIKKIQ